MAKLLQEQEFMYKGVLNTDPSICIDWFDDLGTNNPHAFLSNFYSVKVEVFDAVWATAEHAYAASKVYGVDDELYEQILKSSDPQEAKLLGRNAPVIRSDWEEVKYDIMKTVVWAKFSQNGELGRKLLETGNAYLQEGTFWDDLVWGVNLAGTNPDGSTYIIKNPMNRIGRNWLGTILMETRARLFLAVETFEVGQ